MTRLRIPRPRLLALLAALMLPLLLPASPLAPTSVASSLPPGGAPLPGSGTQSTPPFVRVLDGRTFETTLNGNQVSVVIVGIAVAPGNTDCGQEAARQLRVLAKGGLTLTEDQTIAFDAGHHRVYQATTRDGRVVAQELVRAGVAQLDGTGEATHQYPTEEAQARAAGTGCLWNGGHVTAPSTAAASTAAAPPPVVLPSGFQQIIVGYNLNLPTGFAFLPGGRILVTEQRGRVRLIKNGVLQATPLIDLQNRINNYGDHGLLGMAIDPNFATNGFLYLLYTYENDAAHYSAPKTARLARYTVVGDSAAPASETVILGTTVGTTCNAFPAGTDCIATDSDSHSVGSLRFAADGTLFVSTGDGASYNDVDDNALRSQDLTSLSGKLLHITTTGLGVATNPFWTGDAHANRSKVWAYGFRNPFRFQLRPGSDTPYIGDVGWGLTEELNVGEKGANYGWPCYEGSIPQGGYAPKPVCQALYDKGADAVRTALAMYNHEGFGAAIVGGLFYTGTSYPTQYRGAYFYADYAQSVIRTLTVDTNNTLTSAPTIFASNADGPVDFAIGPDGDLYYISISTGELRRIVYPAGQTSIVASASATPTEGPNPLTVQFSSAGSTNPGGGTLQYNWDFGDGASATVANPSHTYLYRGRYLAILQLSDTTGHTSTATVPIVAGTPPTATITSPPASTNYVVGDTITFAGTGTDSQDGAVPPSSLSWQIIQHHCPGGMCHTHYVIHTTGNGGSFTVTDHGDDSYFEILLTVSNNAGVQGTTSVVLKPRTVHLTLTTVPAGETLVYAGTTYTAPVTITTIPGSTRTIAANDANRTFEQWSDGGAQEHQITIGSTDAAYVITYSALPTTGPPPPNPRSVPANGSGPDSPPSPRTTGPISPSHGPVGPITGR